MLYLNDIDIIFDVLIDEKHIFFISLHIFPSDSTGKIYISADVLKIKYIV